MSSEATAPSATSPLTRDEMLQHRYVTDTMERLKFSNPGHTFTQDEALDIFIQQYGSWDAAVDTLDAIYHRFDNPDPGCPVIGRPVTEADKPYCTLSLGAGILVRFMATTIGVQTAPDGTPHNIYTITITVESPPSMEGQVTVWSTLGDHGIPGNGQLIEPWDPVSQTYMMTVGSTIRFALGDRYSAPFSVPSPDERPTLELKVV